MLFRRKRKTRLCVCFGPWQLISLAAALREEAKRQGAGEPWETVLLLFALRPIPDLRESMTDFASSVWPWDRMVWDNGLLNTRPRDEEWPWPMASYARSIRDHVGLAAIDELWLCHFAVVEHRMLMEAYPRASVVLFEDGLNITQNTPPLTWTFGDIVKLLGLLPGLLLRRKLRDHLASVRVTNWRLSRAYVKRTSRLWYYLAALVPVPPPFDKIPLGLFETSTLRSTLKTVQESPSCKEIIARVVPVSSQDVLFLHNQLEGDHDRELRVYTRIVTHLLEKGYRVFWKDHPLVASPTFSELAAIFPAESFQRMAIPSSWPAELVTSALGFQHCVGLTSSALFYLPRLFGTRVYSFASTLIPEVTEKWVIESGLSFVMAHVPSLDAMPDLRRPYKPSEQPVA